MIYHVYPYYDPKDPDTIRRNKVAQLTWLRQPWKELPVRDRDLPRLYHEDGRSYFYVKDVFDLACKGAEPSDIVCYTNSDIMVRGDLSMRLAAELQKLNALYCYRRDFHHQVLAPIPDHDFAKGFDYVGKDLFAFRVIWWENARVFFPADLILGFEAWDAVMQELIDRTNGTKSGLKDLICHERHASRWEREENRYSLPGQKLCLKAAYMWMIEHGINPGKHGIRMAV